MVYLSSNSKGRMFAVKLYLFAEKQSKKQKLEEIRDREGKGWASPACFEQSIVEGDLFGVPCLIMPYVASIPMNRAGADKVCKLDCESTGVDLLGRFGINDDGARSQARP